MVQNTVMKMVQNIVMKKWVDEEEGPCYNRMSTYELVRIDEVLNGY